MTQEEIQAWEQDCLEKCGWYTHYVFDDKGFPGGANNHTHGLVESFGLPDLQICFPIPGDICHGILWAAVKVMQDGVEFEKGKEYEDILHDYKVMFTPATESGRDVMRMILPDKDGNLKREEIAEPFKRQWFAPNT